MKTLTKAQTAMINAVVAIAIIVPANQAKELVPTKLNTQQVLISNTTA